MTYKGEYIDLSPNISAGVFDYVNPNGSPQPPQLGPGEVLYLRFNRFNPVPTEDAREPWYFGLKEAGF